MDVTAHTHTMRDRARFSSTGRTAQAQAVDLPGVGEVSNTALAAGVLGLGALVFILGRSGGADNVRLAFR